MVRRLQERLWSTLQIPVSFGLATNKLVAQIASKLRKPRGFVVVLSQAEGGHNLLASPQLVVEVERYILVGPAPAPGR